MLHDIAELFGKQGADRLSSKEIVDALKDMEDRPWPEWKNDKPITQRQLAKLLEPFDVTPNTIRASSGKTPKGYYREPFLDLLKRYPHPKPASDPDLSATPPQTLEPKDFEASRSATKENHVADKVEEKSQKSNGCGGVADKKPLEADLGDGDPFLALKDGSLKLKSSPENYPDLPSFLDRRRTKALGGVDADLKVLPAKWAIQTTEKGERRVSMTSCAECEL